MQKDKIYNPTRPSYKGYILIPNYFLKNWVRVLGLGPTLLYLELLSYCHKNNDIVWPTLATLSHNLGISKNSLLSYRKILIQYGLIKKIAIRRASHKHYHSSLYQITPIEGAKFTPDLVQNLEGGSSNFAPGVVQNLNNNNNHINNTNITTTKEEVAVMVNSKKLKEKGTEKIVVLKTIRSIREKIRKANRESTSSQKNNEPKPNIIFEKEKFKVH